MPTRGELWAQFRASDRYMYRKFVHPGCLAWFGRRVTFPSPGAVKEDFRFQLQAARPQGAPAGAARSTALTFAQLLSRLSYGLRRALQ